MKTTITIQPLPPSIRLPDDSQSPVTKTYAGKLTEQELVQTLAPRYAELGHKSLPRNMANEIQVNYGD